MKTLLGRVIVTLLPFAVVLLLVNWALHTVAMVAVVNK